MNKMFWIVIAAIVVIFGGILLFNNKDAKAPSAGGVQPTEHIQGTGNVTLVEYGDYQCPYCGQFYSVIKQVQEKYQGKVKFQFRNLPLLQVHQNAFAAARAAEAAGMQGKFWEMHDLLYENQAAWSESSNAEAYFEQYATQLGLNLGKFKSDAASSHANDVINADIAAFQKTNQPMSTPTFFLDGKPVQPAGYSVDDFAKIIDPVLAQKQ